MSKMLNVIQCYMNQISFVLHGHFALNEKDHMFSRYFQFSTTITRSHPMTLCIPSNPCRFSFLSTLPSYSPSHPKTVKSNCIPDCT